MQGIGGAGNYAVCMAIFFELVPPESFPTYASIVSAVYAISLLLGPILGGLINDSGDWRWVFLLKYVISYTVKARTTYTMISSSVPAGILAMIVVLVFLPNNFPHHDRDLTEKTRMLDAFSVRTLKKVDILGSALLLVATVFLVAALEEAGTRFPWKSPFVIILLVISGILWLAFLAWERVVTLATSLREPVFPWRFMQSRVWIGMMLYTSSEAPVHIT